MAITTAVWPNNYVTKLANGMKIWRQQLRQNHSLHGEDSRDIGFRGDDVVYDVAIYVIAQPWMTFHIRPRERSGGRISVAVCRLFSLTESERSIITPSLQVQASTNCGPSDHSLDARTVHKTPRPPIGC